MGWTIAAMARMRDIVKSVLLNLHVKGRHCQSQKSQIQYFIQINVSNVYKVLYKQKYENIYVLNYYAY